MEPLSSWAPAPIKSKRSTTVAHGSLQAEIKAIAEACKEIEADRQLLEELDCAQSAPTNLHTDSQSAIDLVANTFGAHPRCRHFDRDVHYIRQCVLLGIVRLVKVATEDNAADLLTKLLARDKIRRFLSKLARGFTQEIEDSGAKGK